MNFEITIWISKENKNIEPVFCISILKSSGEYQDFCYHFIEV